jgi:hypothetical protein
MGGISKRLSLVNYSLFSMGEISKRVLVVNNWDIDSLLQEKKRSYMLFDGSYIKYNFIK